MINLIFMIDGDYVLFFRAAIEYVAIAEDVDRSIAIVKSGYHIEPVWTGFRRGYGRDVPVRFEKVRTIRDQPAAFQEAAHRQHALDTSKGSFFDGKVNMMKDAHSSATDLKTTIFHKLYGHAATHSLFGGE